MNIAFCIGNGPSRMRFKLETLQGRGKTYGCNYLIETFPLDHTIVVDRMLLINMVSQGYQNRTSLHTRKKWKDVIGVELGYLDAPVTDIKHRWDNETHWGSGTHALNLAASHGADLVIMIGYDLYSGNIYSNQDVDPRCWIYQISRIFNKFPDTQFVQIQPEGWKVPESWKSENFSNDDFVALQSMLQETM